MNAFKFEYIVGRISFLNPVFIIGMSCYEELY